MPHANWYSLPDRDMPSFGSFDPSMIADDDTRFILERIREELAQFGRGCEKPLYGLRAHCWMPDIGRVKFGYYMAEFNETVLSAPESGKRVVVLPDAVLRPGGSVEVIDRMGNAATTNITIKTIKAQTINRASTYTVNTNSACVIFRSDGENWWAIASSPGGSGTSTGFGDVVGPASATDNAIARYNGTTGKLIQNSGLQLADVAADEIIVSPFNATTPIKLRIQGGAPSDVADDAGDTEIRGGLSGTGMGGDVIIRAGQSVTGPDGDIKIGVAGGTGITIGRNGITTTIDGFAAITPAATASITAASTPLLNLNSALAGSSVRRRVFPVRASITAGTAIMSWAVASGDSYFFRLRCQRKRTDSGGQSAVVNYSWHVQDIAGALTITALDAQAAGGLAVSAPVLTGTKGGTPLVLTIAPTAGTEVWNGFIEVEGPVNT